MSQLGVGKDLIYSLHLQTGAERGFRTHRLKLPLLQPTANFDRFIIFGCETVTFIFFSSHIVLTNPSWSAKQISFKWSFRALGDLADSKNCFTAWNRHLYVLKIRLNIFVSLEKPWRSDSFQFVLKFLCHSTFLMANPFPYLFLLSCWSLTRVLSTLLRVKWKIKSMQLDCKFEFVCFYLR